MEFTDKFLSPSYSGFWLGHILLRKLDTSSKKEIKMIKTSFDEKQQQQQKGKNKTKQKNKRAYINIK